MSRGLVFWILMLIWFVFALLINFTSVFGGYGHVAGGANTLLFFCLFALLGWQVFGPPIRG